MTSSPGFSRGEDVKRRTSLRTLDALHLACAEANEAPLLTLDQALLASAEFFGIATFSDFKPE